MTSESIPVPPAELNSPGEKAIAEAVPAQRSEAQGWYAALDRFLLYLTAGEFGYLILLIIGIIVLVIIEVTDSSILASSNLESIVLWPTLLLVIAFLFNLVAGLAGLILNISTKHAGYPGTGHLLNWIFIFSSFWLFVLLFIVALPNLLYSVF